MLALTLTAEADVFRDSDLACMWFEEFVDGQDGCEKQRYGNRQTDMLVIYDDKHSSDDARFRVSHLRAMKKQELVELAEQVSYWHIDETSRKDDIIDDLLQVSYGDYYEAMYNETSWRNLEPDLVITGYSKGDAVAVFFVGEQTYSESALTNLFYDVPVSGTVEIKANDEVIAEIWISEYSADCYEWDKQDFIKRYGTKKFDPYNKLVLQLLEDCLPEEIEYR